MQITKSYSSTIKKKNKEIIKVNNYYFNSKKK